MFSHSNPVNFYCTLSFTVQHQLPRHRGDSFNGWSQGKFKSVDHGHLCDCSVMSKEILWSTRIRPAICYSYFEYCKAPIFHCRFLLWYPAKRFCHVTVGIGTPLVLHCRVTPSPSSTITDNGLWMIKAPTALKNKSFEELITLFPFSSSNLRHLLLRV